MINKGSAAIMWKEYRSIKYRGKSLFLSIGFTAVAFFLATMLKVNTLEQDYINISTISTQICIYTSAIISYIACVQTLKFWEEKSLKTIDSLLATPLSIKQIIIAKVLTSVIFSVCVSILFLVAYSIYCKFYYGSTFLSLKILLICITIPIIFNTPIGIINGYSMWCLKVGMSKFVQIFSMSMFYGVLASIWNSIDTNGISLKLGYSLFGVALLLWIISIFCLIFANKEKVLLNMPE